MKTSEKLHKLHKQKTNFRSFQLSGTIFPDSEYAPMNFLQSRSAVYWLCQISGWSFYTLFVWLIFSFADSESCGQGWIYSTISASIIGLPMTHVFRMIAHRNKWLDFSPIKLMFYVVIATSIMALLLAVFSEQVAYTALQTTMFHSNVDKLIFILNWFIRMFLWSALYFGIHFFERYRQTEIEKWKLEACLKDSELMALKSQMNPHFLFNALNTIRELTLENPQKAMQAMTQLASILRYSLRSAETQTVPLHEEMKIVKDYLALESLRFEKRLQVVFEVDEQTLDMPIPPLIVQTLVENAVKHGIAELPKGGTITIRVSFNGSALEIYVLNSGQITQQHSREGQNIGIANTRERLSLVFGEKASLSLANKNNSIVEAKVTVPCPNLFQAAIA
jgi:sensor histidine kinase YesM